MWHAWNVLASARAPQRVPDQAGRAANLLVLAEAASAHQYAEAQRPRIAAVAV